MIKIINLNIHLVTNAGFIENIPLHQGGTRCDGHQNHSNNAHRMCDSDAELWLKGQKDFDHIWWFEGKKY